MKVDITPDGLGMELPEELAHLSDYSKYAKYIVDDQVVGFFIPQFTEDGKMNSDWYTFRRWHLGASSAGSFLGLDEYSDPTKHFWEKINLPSQKINTEFTRWGLALEPVIADMWEYWTGDDEGYLDQSFSGKKVREKHEIPCYAINRNFPWLSASLDYIVPPGQVEPFNKEVIDFWFPLEIKSISPFAAEKYELGLPAKYVVQVQQQCIVMGVTYAEIAFLTAGHKFRVLPIHMDLSICQELLEKTRDFWERVLAARELVSGYDFLNEEEKLDIDRQLQTLEPEPSGNDAFKEFFKAKYKFSREESKREGTQEEWDLAVNYKKLNLEISNLIKEKDQIMNKIKLYSALDEEVTFENLGKKGRVTNRRPKEGKAYFGVNIKGWENE